MEIPFIDGTQIFLRNLVQRDINEEYLGWLNNPRVTRYLESGIFPYTMLELEQFFQQLSHSRDQILLAIVEKENDTHIGNVKLGPINWIHRKATFGILIGNERYWGKGMGSEATRLMVDYGFYRLNLRRVELGVYAEHEQAVRSYQNVGFQIEGRFRETSFHEGEYKDGLWMGLLRSEYKGENKES